MLKWYCERVGFSGFAPAHKNAFFLHQFSALACESATRVLGETNMNERTKKKKGFYTLLISLRCSSIISTISFKA
jgi:hypothetical protein